MKALVTGGAGFIGSHLVRRLVADGHDVVVLDDLSTGKRANLPTGADLRAASILDETALAKAVQGRDVAFHLAALVSVPLSLEKPELCHAVNVDGARRVLAAAAEAGIHRLVFASSCAVYGDSTSPIQDEADRPAADGPYAKSKIEGEHLLAASPLETVALRFFNVYGPGQRSDGPYAAVIPVFLRRARAGEPLLLHGGGTQTRDFVHVDDVVKALLRAATAKLSARHLVVNVGSGRAVSIAELAALVSRAVGTPEKVHTGGAATGPARSLASTERAQRVLGFRARVPLEEGLRQLAAAGQAGAQEAEGGR